MIILYMNHYVDTLTILYNSVFDKYKICLQMLHCFKYSLSFQGKDTKVKITKFNKVNYVLLSIYPHKVFVLFV